MAQTLTFVGSSDRFTEDLTLLQHELPRPGFGEVLITMLAAPINPLDIAVLQDKYPVKPQNSEQGRPIPGYDGVGRISECGGNVSDLRVGDLVIMKRHGLGTWRTRGVFNTKDLLKIPDDMDLGASAILRMGIFMAYLLLENHSEKVRPGDWIIVNAATGAVAHFLTQFARRKGLRVISVVRGRSQILEAKRTLLDKGAEIVLETHELAATEALQGKKIMLAFDAVFGAAGDTLIEKLSPGAIYVAYASLGGTGPDVKLSVKQEHIWLKNITFKGFRFAAAFLSLTDEQQTNICSWFWRLLKEGSLTMPLVDYVEWNSTSVNEESLKHTIRKAQGSDVGHKKTIFVFS